MGTQIWLPTRHQFVDDDPGADSASAGGPTAKRDPGSLPSPVPGFALYDAWDRVLASDWDEAVARSVLAAVAGVAELSEQEASEQSRFKLSYVHERWAPPYNYSGMHAI